MHVNIALILKFMPNYFFAPAEYDDVPPAPMRPTTSSSSTRGPAHGLSKIRFHDFRTAYAAFDLPNVNLFEEQIAALVRFLAKQSVTEAQQKDLDFLLTLGELFTLVVYGQLVLENARLLAVRADVVDQIFDFMVRDFSRFAVELHGRAGTTAEQAEDCLQMVRKPAEGAGRAGGSGWRDRSARGPLRDEPMRRCRPAQT